ncbi:hypothetical protein [Rhodococcus erythropolis]|uniref:hypothetical protein n=1 Tax=Rhodococcus erythropolis TaxID=1833 RepID=UPI0008C2F3E4|nr:hypothetical protein [Rhodococcus erythropolis]MDF2468308.1 hypothetical protein [Rhodococcus erythropolis]OFV75279.1 hypothetical protein RERY_41270 [Rhodococcus erythropolis]
MQVDRGSEVFSAMTVVFRVVLGVACVLTGVTSLCMLLTDRSVPTWLPSTEVVVIVGLMAILAYRERRASRSL